MAKKKQTEETNLKAAITKWAELHHWRQLTIAASPFGMSGLPDRILLKSGVVVFIEAKSRRGKQSKEQKEIEILCSTAGIIYMCVNDITQLDRLHDIHLKVYDKKGDLSFLIAHLEGMAWETGGNK